MDINSIGPSNRIMNSYGKQRISSSAKIENIEVKDRLEISKEAKEMQGKDLDIKMDRSKDIDRIKAAIKDGSYKVDSEKLAKAMLDSMRGKGF